MRKITRKNKKKPGNHELSQYQKKLKRNKLEELTKQETDFPEENTRIPSETYARHYDSPTHPVSTDTFYINRNKKNAVIIYPQSGTRQIYSLLIKTRRGETNYIINRKTLNRTKGSPILSSNFQDLYNNPWVQENRAAQMELHTIEQTINMQKENIEAHVNT